MLSAGFPFHQFKLQHSPNILLHAFLALVEDSMWHWLFYGQFNMSVFNYRVLPCWTQEMPCIHEIWHRLAFPLFELINWLVLVSSLWWAIVVSGCPSSVDVRRVSCVVRRASTFDVNTLETTFVIRFLRNFVRMLVLTIYRPISNMGHVGSKTRSPGQI